MIPLPVILVEFLVAFGVALAGANALALLRLRRDGAPARPDGTAPSATRMVIGIVVGVVVTLWAVATWVTNSFSL